MTMVEMNTIQYSKITFKLKRVYTQFEKFEETVAQTYFFISKHSLETCKYIHQ